MNRQINHSHEEAMEQMDDALIAQRRGDDQAARAAFRQAFHLERAAAELLLTLPNPPEPIGLIEKPEYKRRWNTESWEDQQQRALCNWLLDRLENQHYWPDPQQHEPRLQSVAELADKASGDHEFLQVSAIYRGREDFDVAALVAELVESESVPFLPVLRYKPTGLRKREVWEKTWELQR